ncbi:MAG: IS256 family transposase [Anaerolineae bacterium]|nr:IS256 family transposase [Anaerolineae bacterium]
MASDTDKTDLQKHLPSLERIQQELGTAQSIDDFFGKEGIFARLFAHTLEHLLEAELTQQLGYERYEAKGRNSGNSRNGKRQRTLRTSAGDTRIQVPRDRNGEFQSPLLEKHRTGSNEIEEKIIALYAKGVSTRDIQETLAELYGIEVSASTISAITDKVWALVEEWQSRPLAAIYPILYLDALHLKLRRDGKVVTVAVYVVLGVDLEGHRDVLGHWVGDGAEGANFWLSVISDLQARGVQDVFIACMDGLTGFKEAVQAVFPQTVIQRCVIHQIRHSLRYVSWQDRKAFAADLKAIYQAATREEGEMNLRQLAAKWGGKYAIAVRSWENNWADLATMFDYPSEIRRLIYTTNRVEGYHRQLRKVTKSKGALPTVEAVRKLLFLAHRDITKKWTAPVPNWAHILNQLAIRFEGRFPV